MVEQLYVCVDVIITICNQLEELYKVKYLSKAFEIKDLDPLEYIYMYFCRI